MQFRKLFLQKLSHVMVLELVEIPQSTLLAASAYPILFAGFYNSFHCGVIVLVATAVDKLAISVNIPELSWVLRLLTSSSLQVSKLDISVCITFLSDLNKLNVII